MAAAESSSAEAVTAETPSAAAAAGTPWAEEPSAAEAAGTGCAAASDSPSSAAVVVAAATVGIPSAAVAAAQGIRSSASVDLRLRSPSARHILQILHSPYAAAKSPAARTAAAAEVAR